MVSKLKQALSRHPYLSTAVIFIALAGVGLFALNWWKSELQLLLLLYFIVTLGIRLDEISRKIGNAGPSANPHSDSHDTLLAKLDEISISLQTLNRRLATLSESSQAPPAPQRDPQKDR
jgi:hypothetical protein